MATSQIPFKIVKISPVDGEIFTVDLKKLEMCGNT